MTTPDVINNVAFLGAVVVSIPRRIEGESYETPTCCFNVDITENKVKSRYRVECEEEIAGSALNAVEKGNYGDFYGVLDPDRTNVMIAKYIFLTS